ncbi:MAG: ribosome maturation factor RimM [Polyangiales bacterium]
MSGRRRSSPPQSRLRALAEQADARWVALGAVVGTHGLRGTLRVKPYNPDSDLLYELEEIALRRDGVLQVHEIAEVQETGKGVLLRFSDVESVEAAALLRGSELCLPRELLPPLEPGEYYHVDLEGLPVVTADEQPVGTAERVHEYPAASVLCVRSDAGTWEVPMREPYLVEVDLANGRIVVAGLEDLELERVRR